MFVIANLYICMYNVYTYEVIVLRIFLPLQPSTLDQQQLQTTVLSFKDKEFELTVDQRDEIVKMNTKSAFDRPFLNALIHANFRKEELREIDRQVLQQRVRETKRYRIIMSLIKKRIHASVNENRGLNVPEKILLYRNRLKPVGMYIRDKINNLVKDRANELAKRKTKAKKGNATKRRRLN